MQSYTVDGYFPYINFFNTGGDGHYINNLTFPGLTIGMDVDDFVVEVSGMVYIPSAGYYTFGVNSDDGFWMQVGSFEMSYPDPRGPSDSISTFSFSSAGYYSLRLVFYERGGGSELELFAARGSFTVWDSSNFKLVGDTLNGGLAVYSVASQGNSSGSYLPYISSNVESLMFNKGVSTYIRMPFVITNKNDVESLFLRIRYDDGFIAYLNGVEVARRNAPSNPAYNTPATGIHNGTILESIPIQNFSSFLNNGTNVLAIHGMNAAVDSSDFLVEIELIEFHIGNSLYGYLLPTPGEININNIFDFEPNAQFSLPGGVYTNDIIYLDLSSSIPSSKIRFTIDGSNPSDSSMVYTNGVPICITNSVMVVAQVYIPGIYQGPYKSEGYTLLDSTMTNFTSNLPILILSTYGYNIVPDMSEKVPAM
ncbi:MAG TPA: PA14 domain-containing protein, partial [Verrucomicrobiota bacterium]|nr:PA14 domain-containing protein [Verrucomicrobiota bacterium]